MLLNPAHALHSGVSYFTLCVSASVFKICKKILNRSASFLVEAFSLTQGGNHLIWKKITLGLIGWGGGGGVGD